MSRGPLAGLSMLALLLSACAGYSPGALPAGSSVEATLQRMGPPTGEIPLPDGGRRLEYARGPYGKHTFMVDFNGQGQLLRWEQVLTENHFNAIRAGMTATDVRSQIGRASEVFTVGWQEKQTVWAYRYESMFCVWFMVGISPEKQTVIDTSYGPDPMCERRERMSPF